MASLKLNLAWSVEVPVEKLGAHLQAYAELQPTISTLRLCNRFGKGSKAAITRLPVELMAEVEDYVMLDEREKQNQSWMAAYSCFQGKCEPIDHLSDNEEFELWAEYYAECDTCGGCCCGSSGSTRPKKLNDRQRVSLESFLQCIQDDEPPYDTPWAAKHTKRMAEWKAKTGIPSSRTPSLLSQHSDLFLRNFGLQLWVTHAKPKGTAREASTVAYLTLPSSKFETSFHRWFPEYFDYDSDGEGLPTQSGGGVAMGLPTELSKAECFKFSRALQLLSLMPDSPGDKEVTPSVPEQDEGGVTEEQKDSGSDTESVPPMDMVPKLRMLYCQDVGQEY